MKMIVITQADGSVVGATYVNEKRIAGQMAGGLLAGPGETSQEVDVPDDFARIMDGEQLYQKLRTHMGKKP
ncbi:MAG TPA: hypothetical protein VN089_13375 [Duganella sp.]|nr:hypothetical protein [Duganella sp.]